ncbi:MAG: hypothetical protein AB1445_02245 [Bacillota bacterium]
MEMAGFERFADFFFDGLIFDWIVQSKITRSLARTQEQLAKVLQVMADLRLRQQQVEAKIAALAQKRQRLLGDPGSA